MLKPGMILCDRYEILETVGAGGMSIVYKAKCHRLNRNVAIKVLKPEFSNDANFVTKFRIEAQSYAGLTHPNIVNVYDVCDDDGLYFIVMELVEGITLKEYIAQKGRLTMDQVIDFSMQIASGLEAAHESHVIHRDIKPQNIIVARNGNLKVTDFGIAKAATSNTMTSGAMGSVHYISPEQARGGYSDERSDIYSLGITMYEMVTGRVPYEGENNVSVALMHIQNDMIPPRQYYPDIYSSIEKIILKATQKKPERRYLTSSALIADLKRVLANPNIDIIVAPTAISNSPTQEWSKEDMEAIRTGSAAKSGFEDGSQLNVFPVGSNMNPNDSDIKLSTIPVNNSKIEELFEDEFDYDDEDELDYEPVPVVKKSIKRVEDDYEEEYDDNDDTPEIDPKLEKAVMVAGVAAAVIIAIILFIIVGNMLGLFKFGSSNNKKTTAVTTEQEQVVKVPDLYGLHKDAAEVTLKKEGFTNYKFESEKNDEIQEGYVFNQSVSKDTMVPATDELIIYISAGANDVEVPDVLNYEQSQADTLLADAGFKVTHKYENHDEVEKDKVISMDPAGETMAPAGSTVTIVVSNGPDIKMTSVPDLYNLTEADARNKLAEFKLSAGTVTQENSESIEEGKVIRQGLAVGSELEEGKTVDFVISLGPVDKKISYTASFTGTVTAPADYDFENGPLSVSVFFTQGNVQHTVHNLVLTDANPVDVSGAQAVEGLESNSGTVSIKVSNETGDYTGTSSKDISISFTEVTE